MISISVPLAEHPYNVHVGAGLLERLGEFLPDRLHGRACAVVTDSNVGRLYGERAVAAVEAAGCDAILLSVPAGEPSKSMGVVAGLCERMVAVGLDRSSFVVALGGGVVGDLAGFVAAIYYRGIPFVQVPTTIVAQVDSAVGGKTGVNTQGGKNLIGAFYQPEVVVTDTATLNSLPEREFNEGFAEIIKHAAICSPELLSKVESFRRGQPIDDIIADNVAIKAAIVAEDERETTGTRAQLNFGHTVGHAIENASGYGEFLHGEAIAIGLRVAIDISVSHYGLPRAEADRLVTALARFSLPTVRPAHLGADVLRAAMMRDKKFDAGRVRFVVCESLGAARLVSDLSMDAIESAIEAAARPWQPVT